MCINMVADDASTVNTIIKIKYTLQIFININTIIIDAN
jgi:hypothetical protein